MLFYFTVLFSRSTVEGSWSVDYNVCVCFNMQITRSSPLTLSSSHSFATLPTHITVVCRSILHVKSAHSTNKPPREHVLSIVPFPLVPYAYKNRFFYYLCRLPTATSDEYRMPLYLCVFPRPLYHTHTECTPKHVLMLWWIYCTVVVALIIAVKRFRLPPAEAIASLVRYNIPVGVRVNPLIRTIFFLSVCDAFDFNDVACTLTL